MVDFKLLQQMIDDMTHQSDLYKPTHFWEQCSSAIINDLTPNTIKNFRSLTSSLNFFVPTYSFPNYNKNKNFYLEVIHATESIPNSNKRLMLKLHNFLSGKVYALADYRAVMASNVSIPPYIDLVSESTIGNPIEQFTFENRKFSRSLLNYMLGINFIKKNCSTEFIKNVMEIGGGFGSLGELLLGDPRNNIFYINADIPPIAFISEYYLKQNFGKKNIAGYNELKSNNQIEIDTIKQHYKAINICSWQTPLLTGTIDLFINFISFQEMEPSIVQNYCQIVNNLRPKLILLRNLKEGKQKKNDTKLGVINPIRGDDYDRYLPNYKLIDTNSLTFGFQTEDGYHSELRLYKKLPD